MRIRMKFAAKKLRKLKFSATRGGGGGGGGGAELDILET